HQWEENPAQIVCRKSQRRTQNHRANILSRSRLKQVRATSRAVAHVIANQIGDHRRIAWIVFRNIRLNLANEVRAHIGGFRKDATAELSEESHKACAETEAYNQRRSIRRRCNHIAKAAVQQEEY